MGSVTACFARVGKTLSPEDREAILKPIRDEVTGRISAASKADPNADANAVALEVLDGMLSEAGGKSAEKQQAPSQPNPEASPASGRGASQPEASAPAPSANTVFTEDAAAAARARLKAKLNRLNSGIDPEMLQDGITLAGYHIERGARSFAAYVKAMLDDMGDAVRPYLKSWYMGVKYDPRAAGFDGMSSAAEVDAAEVESKPTPKTEVDDRAPRAQDATDATRPLDRPGTQPLEGTLAGDVRAPGEGGNAGAGAAAGGGRDVQGDAGAGGAGRDADRGVGDGPAEPPAAGARGGRTGRASGGRRGVRNGGGGQSGAERPADAGRAGDVNPAPNAAPIQPPAFQPKDFTITDELALGEGGQKTKYRANVDAIRLLKDLDITGRAATVDEQQVLARYVGWGGLSQAFDGDNESWAREYAELKDLLTPDEYADARQSTRYAHYTSREIIGGMYSALRRLGFTGGRVLEPGGGVGNFLGLMPAELKTSSRATLIEREPIAAGIARHLYPQQNIQRADFAEFIGNDDYFDAAIGNPPFADTPLTDSSGRKHLTGLSVHNYFFAKSVDHLREGGVLAMVVTSSFLDARSDRARRYIAERTRFLGAIRLPNNAFSKNANTEVTTDIIFLQKRPEAEWGGKAAMQEAQAWLNTATVPDPRGGADLAINQYFADRPEMMLGTYGRYGTMYGPDQPALVAKPGQDTAALMQAAIANLPADVYVPPAVAGTDRLVDQTVVALKNPEVQEGGYYVEGDKLFQRLPDVAGEARAREITPSTQWTEKTTLGDVGYARLVALSQMRGTLRALLAAELSGAKTMEPLRGRLNKEYDAYVKEHGLLNDQATTRVFDDDPDFPLLASLEHDYTPGMGIAAAKRQGIKPYRSTAKKAPIFTQRVVQAREQVRRVETPADALAVSIAERGRIDSAYIGELLGRDSQQVLEELASGTKPLLFRDPATDEYVLRDAYLSGNVRTKLAQARQAGLFANARELEKVQPEDVGAADIYARIGSPWVPEDVYRDFALDLFGDGTKAAVVYVPLNSSFAVGVKPGSAVASSNTWGTAEYPGEDLLSALMNNREIKVTYRDQDGKTHVDQDATERANVKAQDIRNRFQDWLFADADRSEVLVRAYNDTNNNYVTRNYDGSWMTFPGKVPDSIIKFRRHQRNAISRIVQDRTALLDHVVGAGKTFTIVSAAMELKRTGLAKKPLIVVPNHLVKQWASDFYRLYPGANILTATKKDFAKANRRKFLAKIATGDWDAVVMAHSSFGFLRPAPDFEAQFNEGQVKRIVDTIKAVEDQDGDERAKKRTVKQLEALKERLENRIKSLRQKPIDNLLDYDQIGVDQLFVDEAHLFKNLMFTTKMQNIRGLGDSKGSQRAYDMYVKVAETYAKNGRGQGVVFATGTPVSNTLAEMYHMMRYLMPQAMEDLGFQSFDAWANTFASVNQEWDQKSSGDGFKAINTMSSFVNTHELLRIFDQVADTVTMEDIKAAFREENDGKEFPLPKLKTGRRQPVSLVKSTAQTQYMETIAARAAALERRKGPPQKGEDNALVIMTDARKAAMDVRLVEPTIIEREKGGRIDRAANEVLARWNQYADVKGTQLVFSDLGTPIKTVKAELREYQELQARMAPLADEDLVASAQLGDETAIGKLEDAEAARDELDKKGADWLTAIQAALRGFSVYDDLRAALVERGIPESQIAFIHDYNTDEQKAALFRKVNAGEIRVLMGSTAKLGAGTNVQERLVALHHLDVPWKPSDIEQREGRILRQGNRLEREVPAFEVEILAYVTQDTLDMKMWMIQERKLKMINQLRTRKIDREIENSFEDMEMSAGEMQAAATGNMDMLREIQLRTEVKKLEQRKRAFEAQRNDLESRRRRAEKEVAELPPMIERYDVAAAAADQYNQALSAREVPRSTINGETVTDRGEALKKLRGLADTHERALEERRMSLAEAYETAARQGRESGMAEGAAINAAEAAKQAMDKELPKPKMAVEFNGKTYGSKPALAQAATEFYGDAQPIEWTLPDGKVLNRRELITKALAQQVAESVSEESVVDVGRMGPFSVTIEGQRDRRGDKMLEVLVTPEGGEPESNLVYIRGDEDTRAARAAAEVVSAAEMMIFRASGQADYARSRLEAAKRALDDLKKTSVAGEWPEADKLAKARAAHRQVLDRLAGKRDASTNLRQTGRPEANETDVVFRVDSTDLPADTAAAYAAPTEDDQRAVQRLQFRIARYTPGVRLDAVAAAGGRKAGQPLQGADRARVAAAELLRALTGRRAVFFTAHRTNFINGVHSSSQPDVLFLRADASRPHMAVLGHEFLHGLRADRPDLYEALRERIRLVATGRAAHAADLQAKRQGFGQPLLSNDKLEEEFLADVMGDSWMDAGFWKSLAGKEPNTLLRRAFTAAMRFVDDVLRKIADLNPFGTNAYLSDIKAARAAMAQALRDYVEVESVGAPAVDLNFSAGGDAPWYSALAREISAARMNVAGPAAWQQIIDGLIKAGKVKADEVEWSGVREWLGLQQGKVTREAVSGYLRENGVRVQETVLGGNAPVTVRPQGGDTWSAYRGDEFLGRFDFDGDEQDAVEEAEDRFGAGGRDAGSPKFGQYTLPGGTNYREVLLTLPEKSGTVGAKFQAREVAGGGAEVYDRDTGRMVERATTLRQAVDRASDYNRVNPNTPLADKNYTSSHWAQKNVLAHIRVNDRTDADGRRMLFVEEIQSDWAQQGKKQGFAKPVDPRRVEAAAAAAKAADAELDRVRSLHDKANGDVKYWAEKIRKLERDPRTPPEDVASARAKHEEAVGKKDDLLDAVMAANRAFVRAEEDLNAAQRPPGGPPSAPFVDKTDKWVALALKRVIKMAVDEGYDRVAFVNGEQSAERYDLSKQVRSVEVSAVWPGGSDVIKGYSLKALTPDGRSIMNDTYTAEQLPDVIGKDLAEKIVADISAATPYKKYSGLDLKVGGEGMRAFYDRIVPNVLKDVLRKVGGGQVGTVQMTDPATRYAVDDKEGFRREFETRDAAMEFLKSEDYMREGQPWLYAIDDAGRETRVSKTEGRAAIGEQPGFDITGAMRERAAGGMPMFSMAQRQAQTDTPEFKRWFGASKVVDADGKPLVVYHGAPDARFASSDGVFRSHKNRLGMTDDPSGAFWFAGSLRTATTYADDRRAFDFQSAEPGVVQAYLSIQNPLVIDGGGGHWRDVQARGKTSDVIEQAIAEGRDGVIIRNVRDDYSSLDKSTRRSEATDTFVAFRPEQIKSAIGNRGTFDPANPDIRFSRALNRRDFLLGAAASAATGGAQGKTTLGKAQPIPEAVLRAALPDDVQKILIGSGVGTTNLSGAKATKQALERIAESGPQELRALARQTAALMPERRLMLTVVGGQWNAHGAVSWGGPEGPHLRLMNGRGMDGLTYGTFIHEAMHAAVLARYINLNTAVVRENDTKLGGAPNAAKALDQFRQVWSEFKDATRGQRTPDANLQLAIDEARGDPDEFFVRALTDPLLQKHMASLEYKGKTLWERFKDWVKTSLFGLGPSDGVVASWLDAATMAAQDLLQAMPSDPADYGRLGKYQGMKSGSGAKFSRALDSGGAVDTLQSNDTARRLSERVIDVLRSDSTIGLLGRTVGTPYHLAHAKRADGSLRNPDLRKVYDEAQDYLNDINTFANDPAELAPGVVPMLNKWSDARRPLRLAGEQRAKLARALFEGTLGWTRDDQGNAVQTDDPHKGIEWTGTELRQRFGFNDADVQLYQQTRAAIGRSLDLMAGAEVARQMGGRDLPEGLRAMVSRGDTGRFKGLVLGFLTQQVDAAESAVRTLKEEHREQLARFAEATPGPDTDAMRDALKARQAAALEQAQAKLGKWKSLQAGVQKTYERVEDLKDRGYMPLMRFGPHTVTVRDIDTKEVVFFGMYETQAEANVEARKLRETAAPNEAVSRGEMSQEQWRLFRGMSPETVELFGQVAGIERTPVFEEYIRRTKANHSALKRLIQRKGTPGFSEDVQRVLAAFLTSNARAAAANLHAGAMEEATLEIDQERGLIKDYATKLTQYVQNPTDEAQAIRGLMFVQFIGGSVASAMVNMTQPFTMTLPWLSQHGGPVGAARLLSSGMRAALTRIAPDSDLGKAVARAEKDGIVSPQALHELQGQAVNRFGRTESALRAMGVGTKAAEAIDASLRRVLFAWGGFFSLAEQFNRRSTFIAAYQLATEQRMADPFAFAAEAVSETQGVYNRGNRPQWARGPVGATVMTFKQFSIAYIEFLSRLPRREKAIALFVLMIAAGLEGLPFMDDLDDLIDTIAQRLFGKAYSFKRQKVEWLSEIPWLGRDGAEWVLRGASALPGFPVDLAGRMSLGNMLPGTGLLRTDGSRDKSAEVLEALGPAGGVVRDALRGEFLPVAMRNAGKAAEMARTGEYRDERGRKVADVDGADAVAKGLGFQPREIARESRDAMAAQSVVAQARRAESDIVRLWAQGIVDNEPDKIAEAQDKLAAWNERNPGERIVINRLQLARMARDMRRTRDERVIQAAPKELRGRVAQDVLQ